MVRQIMCLAVVGLILVAVGVTAEQSEKEEAALSAAQEWLKLVDDGEYEKSWEEAAEFLKNAVKKEQLEEAFRGIRKPLGKLVSRKEKSKTYMTTLPGAPDGEYVVIQFESSFENKKNAVETVTPMMEKDGKWRISGYYIK